MNWKKFLTVVIIAPIILVITGIISFIAYCELDSSGILVSYDNYLFQKKLIQRVDRDSKKIHIIELTNFDWDTVCSYPPYSYHNEENKWSLIFKKNNMIVNEVQILRGITGDLKEPTCANRNGTLILAYEILNGEKKYFVKLTDYKD